MLAEVAASGTSETLLVAIFSGAGTAIIGLGGRLIWRSRFGKREDEEKATRAAHEAVQAVEVALAALRTERQEYRDKIQQLEERGKTYREEIRRQHDHIMDMEDRIADLMQKEQGLRDSVDRLTRELAGVDEEPEAATS